MVRASKQDLFVKRVKVPRSESDIVPQTSPETDALGGSADDIAASVARLGLLVAGPMTDMTTDSILGRIPNAGCFKMSWVEENKGLV